MLSSIGHYIKRQILFWSILHASLSGFLFLGFRFFISNTTGHITLKALHVLEFSLLLAILHGAILGLISYIADKLLFHGKSSGLIIGSQILMSLLTFAITFEIARDYIDIRFVEGRSFSENAWKSLLHVMLCQYTFASIIVALGNQTVRKYGRDMFVPLMLGVYREPREERRIFLFIDLKSSTTLAETLGHMRYSRLVQEFMLEINNSIHEFHANVYQYAGDEVVITWPLSASNARRCCQYFWHCWEAINRRSHKYLRKYGVVPVFKAGADCGTVVAVEIGDLKRDIAYHGDPVNTAFRIQSLCNPLEKRFLVSGNFNELMTGDHYIRRQYVGAHLLRGKETAIDIYSIEQLQEQIDATSSTT